MYCLKHFLLFNKHVCIALDTSASCTSHECAMEEGFVPLVFLHFAILCGTASAIFVLNCIYLFPEWVAYLLSHSLYIYLLYTFTFIQLVHNQSCPRLPTQVLWVLRILIRTILYVLCPEDPELLLKVLAIIITIILPTQVLWVLRILSRTISYI